MPPQTFLESLLSHGPLGIVCAILLVWIHRKDKELQTERAARVEDAKAYTTMAVALQREVMTAVATVRELFDAQKDRRGGQR